MKKIFKTNAMKASIDTLRTRLLDLKAACYAKPIVYDDEDGKSIESFYEKAASVTEIERLMRLVHHHVGMMRLYIDEAEVYEEAKDEE